MDNFEREESILGSINYDPIFDVTTVTTFHNKLILLIEELITNWEIIWSLPKTRLNFTEFGFKNMAKYHFWELCRRFSCQYLFVGNSIPFCHHTNIGVAWSISYCLQFQTPTRVFVRTQFSSSYLRINIFFSGDEYFGCVWFESRTPNVLEFQFWSKLSTTPSFDLCDNNKFLQKTWTTQASTLRRRTRTYIRNKHFKASTLTRLRWNRTQRLTWYGYDSAW